MGALVELAELAVGQSTQLSTPEGRWFTGQGRSAGGITAAGQNDFVYSPGNPAPHDNVFASWPLLIAAVNAVAGMRRILVDPTFAGDPGPHVPAGTWAVNNVQFFGFVPSSGFITTLTFDDGAKLTASAFYVENLIFSSVSTAAVMTFVGGTGGDLFFGGLASALFSSAAAPFVHVATDAGSVNMSFVGESFVGDGVNPTLQVDGAATAFVVVLQQASLFANATSGTGTVSLTFAPGGSGDSSVISDANVQFPQLANLIPSSLSPTTPFPQNEQFLANLALATAGLDVAVVVAVNAVQTSNNAPTDVPGTQLGDATVPMSDHAGGQVEVKVIARIPSTDQTVSWHAQAAFKRRGATINAGPLLNVGGAALASFAPTAGDTAALAGTTIGLDVGANGITVQVTGLNAVTIDWSVQATYVYTHA